MAILPVILAATVGLSLLVYALVSGFDLGVGLLGLIAPRRQDREAMLASLEPVWYGNALWLVLASAVLAFAFPAETAGLRALSPWLALLLAALLVRAAAYALRGRAGALRPACDIAFGLASLVCVLCQGLVLGAILSGVPATGGLFGLDLVLGLLCAAGLVGADALLGAGWLIRRAEGAPETFGREVGHAAIILTLGALLLAVAWSALAGSAVAARWFTIPGLLLPALFLMLALGLGGLAWRALWRPDRATVPAAAAGLMLAVFLALTASLWPDAAPGGDLLRGHGSRLALQFTAFDALLCAPVLLAYLIHAWRSLRARPATAAAEGPPTHAGRRASGLRNALHLS